MRARSGRVFRQNPTIGPVTSGGRVSTMAPTAKSVSPVRRWSSTSNAARATA